jgi:hypothetical protein
MYKCFKVLSLLPVILMALTLSACGGASSDAGTNPPPAKPGPQSSASEESSQTTSSNLPTSSTPASSSTPNSAIQASSSKDVSSPSSISSSYGRVSRTSSSARQTSSTAVTVIKDTTAPVNAYLLVYEITDHSITLMWDDAIDDTGIKNYEIRRNGIVIATPGFHINRLTDDGLAAFTDYQYTITAIDLVGNSSGESSVFSIRTLAKKSSSSSSSAKSNNSSSSKTVSSINSSKSSISSATFSSSRSSAIAQSTKLRWSHPSTRVNGKYLELDEIAGYSIRYRKRDSSQYDYLLLSGNQTTTLTTDTIPLDGIIEIATMDSDGLYSQYVNITPLD